MRPKDSSMDGFIVLKPSISRKEAVVGLMCYISFRGGYIAAYRAARAGYCKELIFQVQNSDDHHPLAAWRKGEYIRTLVEAGYVAETGRYWFRISARLEPVTCRGLVSSKIGQRNNPFSVKRVLFLYSPTPPSETISKVLIRPTLPEAVLSYNERKLGYADSWLKDGLRKAAEDDSLWKTL